MMTLQDVADELGTRLMSTFLPDTNGRRPCHGNEPIFADDPNWKELVLFHEYFHGETGRGCGAGHQTGWTSLVARLIVGRGKKFQREARERIETASGKTPISHIAERDDA